MVLFKIATLLAIVVIGIITSYTDVKEGKIKNKVLVLGLCVAFFLQSIIIFTQNTDKANTTLLLINTVAAIILGFLFWDLTLWTPGDGKLYTIFVILLQIVNNKQQIGGLPAFSLLINIFIPAFLLFATISIAQTSLKHKLAIAKTICTKKELFFFFLSLFSISWLVAIVFPNQNNILAIIISFYVVIGLLKKITKLKIIELMFLVAIVRIIVDRTYLTSSFWLQFIIVFSVLIFLQYFITELGAKRFTKTIPIHKLKEGMMPAIVISETTHSTKKQNKKAKQKNAIKMYLEETQKVMHTIPKTYFTKKEIRKVKALQKKHPELKTIDIQESLPFAVFIFLGALLTFFLGTDVVSWVILKI